MMLFFISEILISCNTGIDSNKFFTKEEIIKIEEDGEKMYYFVFKEKDSSYFKYTYVDKVLIEKSEVCFSTKFFNCGMTFQLFNDSLVHKVIPYNNLGEIEGELIELNTFKNIVNYKLYYGNSLLFNCDLDSLGDIKFSSGNCINVIEQRNYTKLDALVVSMFVANPLTKKYFIVTEDNVISDTLFDLNSFNISYTFTELSKRKSKSMFDYRIKLFEIDDNNFKLVEQKDLSFQIQ